MSTLAELKLTEEQELILETARSYPNSSLMIDALAGTAKTFILTKLSEVLDPGVGLAFNVRMKIDLEEKFPKTWTVLTMNGLGHRAWNKAINKRCEVDKNKLSRLVSKFCRGVTDEDWQDIRDLVTRAMYAGIVPSSYPQRSLIPDTIENWKELAEENWISSEEKVLKLAHDVLTESVSESFKGVISFDDQVYMSTMYNGQFPRFPRTLVDESQDLNILNHIQLQKCSAGPLVIVGDPRQSIYAFRGAHTNSMEKIRNLRQDWKNLNLTVTFRCPELVVERQLTHVPGYKAFHTNPRGRVLVCNRYLRKNEERLGKISETGAVSWTWKNVEDLGYKEICIISRNNAQLINMAFKLLRRRVGVTMLGRDIGRSLVNLSKKIFAEDNLGADECAAQTVEWMDQQVELARASNKEENVSSIRDRGESLLAVIEGSDAEDAREIRLELKNLFSRETGGVLLSTVHRAKGFEYDVVLHLDPWRIPSRYAQRSLEVDGNPVPMEQENNLRYVCETRTKQILVLADLEKFE